MTELGPPWDNLPSATNPLGHGVLTPLGQAGELPSPPWTTRKRLLDPLVQARKLASPPGTASISTPWDRNRGPLLPPLGQMSSVGGVCLLNGIAHWQCFKSRWNYYVKATRLEGTDRIIQLLECCDDQLHKDLTRNAGGTLTEMTEDEVFAAMRRLAVREENTMVARVALHNMRQDRDEPIRAYGARLR